jgi:hypothetical protein
MARYCNSENAMTPADETEIPWKQVMVMLEKGIIMESGEFRQLNGYWTHYLVPESEARALLADREKLKMAREFLKRIVIDKQFLAREEAIAWLKENK